MEYWARMYLSRKGEDKEILMLKDPSSGFYFLPGGILGNLERGSNDTKEGNGRLDCVVRDTQRKSGIKVLNPKFIGIVLLDYSESSSIGHHINFFRGTRYEESEGNTGSRIWVPEHKVRLAGNPKEEMIYRWLMTGRKFSGVVKFDKENNVILQKSFVNYL